ncbi:hypothetical protein [Culicoidibacter larvae]|uniref:hypothetical protein n=1 Tax=Culicoidibacter larvae TaxID=2579976 RepID=UPI001F54C2A8|nr:hypothetical protein [Culicoidibacter larvae]
MNDELAVQFRKMLLIEQYAQFSAAELFNEIFIDMPLKYLTILFTSLIQNGKLIKIDADIMAANFYSPLFLNFFKTDSVNVQSKFIEEKINKHIETFFEVYSNK